MLKYVVFAVALFSFFSNLFAQDCDCDHWISSGETNFDAVEVLPGQTICLEAGNRGKLQIKNIVGTTDAYIRIQSCGGITHFNLFENGNGIKVKDSRFFEISGGTDTPQIQIHQTIDNGIDFIGKTHHFRVEHLMIKNTQGFAIKAGANPLCDLSLNQGFFVMEGVELLDLDIYACRAGIQIGHPDFGLGMETICGTLLPHSVEDVEIRNVQIEEVLEGGGMELFGVKGVVENCQIQDVSGNGILLGRSGDLTIERCEIRSTDRAGISFPFGGKLNVINNLLEDIGAVGSPGVSGKMQLLIPFYPINQITIDHNTFVRSGASNVRIQNTDALTSPSFIRNNIFCEPEELGLGAGPHYPYVRAESHPLMNFETNLFSEDVTELNMVNPSEGNYQLTHESNAINQGIDLLITTDLIGQERNLAGAPDQGAYEYVPEPIAFFDQIPLQALYVNDFKYILGDPEEETRLLEFCVDKGFNALTLYNLAYIHSNLYDLTDPEESDVLAEFMDRAKRDFGIVQIGAVGEKDASFDRIESFNALQEGDWFRSFDVLNLEFEFWRDAEDDVFAYYCDTYLSPGGYPCSNAGAYAFYRDQLELIDERAHGMGIISEIYLGYMSEEEGIELAERVDRILLHHYRTSDMYGDGTSIYNYHTYRIHSIALSERKPAVMPIFSSRSYHMGPWLLSHEPEQAMDTWLNGVEGYEEDDTEGVHDLPISGCQWYRYTSFPDAEFFLAPEEPETTGVHFQLIQNPVANTVEVSRIESSSDENVEVILYAMQGSQVAQWNSSTNTPLALPYVPSGIYLLQIYSTKSGIIETKKIRLD